MQNAACIITLENLPIYDQKQLCLRFMDIQDEKCILAHKNKQLSLVDANSNNGNNGNN